MVRFSVILIVVQLLIGIGYAGAAPGRQNDEEKNDKESYEHVLGEKLENLGRIYKNDSHDIIQEVWLLGRYHGQYYRADGSGNPDDDGYETRRLRMGGQMKLLKSLTLHAQMVSGSDVSPFYDGFSELWAQWAFSPEILLTVGQQKHRFTHDRNVSSRYINYLERSMFTNMFGLDYTPAVTLQGEIGKTTYYTGFFSNATGRNMGDSFTNLDSGYSFLGAAYYDLDRLFGADSSYFHVTYLHSNANDRATNLDRFEDGISSALILTKESAALVVEVTAGFESEDGNAVGINFQPSYFLTDTLQLATRYQFAISSDEKGLSAQQRYEEGAGLSKGDMYNAAYLGLNYYIAKHRLKLMGGVEYSTIGGEEVWTTSAMIRFYFGPHSGGSFPMNQMLPGHFFEYD